MGGGIRQPAGAPAGMGNYTFKRADRVYRKEDYVSAYRGGKRIETSSLTIIVRSNNLGRPRMGIGVRRTIRGAVKRNRVKRLLREFFRLHKTRFSLSNDYIFSVKRLPSDLTYHGVEHELRDLLFVGTC